MPFKKATKARIKLRMAIEGPAGSGKTYTALTVAKYLADGQPVALIDTERGSASKYADLFAFDVLELESFHPQKYVEAINEAAQAGYAVVVIDSLSHAWDGKGGILEIVRRKGNSFNAWGDVAPIEDALLDALTGADIHIIATMRTKTAYEVEKNEKTGKMEPRKVGLAAVQRQGLEYEFDVVGRLDDENTWTTTKTRCPALTGALISKPGREMAATLRTWLSGAPAPTPTPTPAPLPVASRTPQQMQEDLDEEDAALRAMGGVDDEADDTDGVETITYTPDEPEPTAEPPAEEWKFLQDVEFRQTLNKLNIRTVAAIEEFVYGANIEGGRQPQREIAMQAARDLLAKRQPQKPATGTRGRQPSALGATLAPGETIPDSLAELPVGQKGA